MLISYILFIYLYIIKIMYIPYIYTYILPISVRITHFNCQKIRSFLWQLFVLLTRIKSRFIVIPKLTQF